MFQGSSWQRCRLHVARNLLQSVPKAQQKMVAAALRSVFTQQGAAGVESSGIRSPSCSPASSPERSN